MRSVTEILQDYFAARRAGDQELLNDAALELTTKIWGPLCGMTFDELLESFGYVETPKSLKRRKEHGIFKQD